MAVSTHSRAKAAAGFGDDLEDGIKVSTHSRAKAAADFGKNMIDGLVFQHTAARRRLRKAFRWLEKGAKRVSTHSRAKAAANRTYAMA